MTPTSSSMLSLETRDLYCLMHNKWQDDLPFVKAEDRVKTVFAHLVCSVCCRFCGIQYEVNESVFNFLYFKQGWTVLLLRLLVTSCHSFVQKVKYKLLIYYVRVLTFSYLRHGPVTMLALLCMFILTSENGTRKLDINKLRSL